MLIKKTIPLILCAFLMTACMSREAKPLGSDEPSEYDTETTANMKAYAESVSSAIVFVEGETYYFVFYDNIKSDTDKMQYLGDVVHCEDVKPKEEFHSNRLAVGTPIYRCDNIMLYIKYSDDEAAFFQKYPLTASDKQFTMSKLPAYVFVEGKLYRFSDGGLKCRNTEKMKYLGEIAQSGRFDAVPEEEFHANYLTVGSKVYRFDDKTLYTEEYVDLGEYRAAFWTEEILDENGELVNAPPRDFDNETGKDYSTQKE